MEEVEKVVERAKRVVHVTSLDVASMKYVLSSLSRVKNTKYPVKELYGGAMSIVVPKRFRDVSDFRPVPDSQEVFTCLDTSETLIVEILQYQNDVSDEKAAKFFFEELAEQNDASSFSILSSELLPVSSRPKLPSSTCVTFLKGIQDAAKFREKSKNKIAVFQCVVRLRNVLADLLITLTVPIQINLSSSSAKVVTDSVLKHGVDLRDSENLLRTMIHSFAVLDWSLFV